MRSSGPGSPSLALKRGEALSVGAESAGSTHQHGDAALLPQYQLQLNEAPKSQSLALLDPWIRMLELPPG